MLVINNVSIFHYDLPLVAPLQVKGHTLATRSGLLLNLQDEAGNAGWGEIAPLPGMSRETLAEAQAQLQLVRTALTGATFEDDQFTLHNHALAPDLIKHTPSVRWGVEQALWNLHAARHGTPLHHLLAPHRREQITINGLLAGSVDEIRAAARRMRDEGWTAVKLKVGRRPLEEEIALTRHVREIIGNDVALRLDANRAWNWDTAMRFGEAVADCQIAYIEEPLADATQLPRFIKHSAVPVALDETLSEMIVVGGWGSGVGDREAEHKASTDLLKKMHQHYHGVAAWVIKPSLLGGVGTALRLAHHAEQSGAQAVFSSLFETGLTITTLAQLAVTLKQNTPTGLDTYRWLQEDVLDTRLDMQGGVLKLHPAPGIVNTLQRVG